ncbi:META domain-containing protein [Tabrizicola aquatica]|uniref:META domain-containing protein n=1 Tax=Tabrizicola aquatica TaxID=909926 RepID=UPI000CD28088|nr:META domain-containing protein [Tabrizicola aquatica]
MRKTLLSLAMALLPFPALADDPLGRTWELLAVDGVVVDYAATLKIEADGAVSGKAPCNSWGSRNSATLPALALGPIRATRMACDRLAEEQAFFTALGQMQEVKLIGGRNLVLTGADGQSMEYVIDRMNSLTRCATCPPKK